MESVRPLTLIEAIPKEDRHLIDGAVLQYRHECGVLGRVKASQNFFAIFPTLASLPWPDSDDAYIEAQWEREAQRAVNEPTAILPTPVTNGAEQRTSPSTTHQESRVHPATSNSSNTWLHVQGPAMTFQATFLRQQPRTEAFSYQSPPWGSMPSILTSPQKTLPAQLPVYEGGTHGQHNQVDAHSFHNQPSHQVPQRSHVPQRNPKAHTPPHNFLDRYCAAPRHFHPSPSHNVITQNGNTLLQSHALHSPFHPPAPTTAGQATPLEIPYLGKMCEICGNDFVWKKTATRCFKCLLNPPSDLKIAEIFLRAMRGIDSCSNCYDEADRGENMHCHDCHKRQKLKTKRHAAKVKARRARQASQVPLASMEDATQQEVSQTYGVQPYGLQHHGVQHHSVQHYNNHHQNNHHHELENHDSQHQGLQAVVDPAPVEFAEGFMACEED